MQYQTRRARRIEFERARKVRRRQRAKRWLGLSTIAIAIIAVVVSARFMTAGDENQPVSLFGGTKKSSNIVDPPKPTAAETITKGLPAKLQEFNEQLSLPRSVGASDQPGRAEVAVSLIDLTDKGRGSMNYNGDTQFTSASTYKLFIAYMMIRDVENGSRTWSSKINGQTWDSCLTRMIVYSDNACPEAYLASRGYSSLDATVKDLGMSTQTDFDPYNMRTSANDLARLLEKFYRGEIISQENWNKLTDLMKRQNYRQGIPTGIGESGAVADKVGFLDYLLHDAGVVYNDKGDYVLVVMTNGYSWEYIAKVTGYINGVMRQ